MEAFSLPEHYHFRTSGESDIQPRDIGGRILDVIEGGRQLSLDIDGEEGDGPFLDSIGIRPWEPDIPPPMEGSSQEASESLESRDDDADMRPDRELVGASR